MNAEGEFHNCNIDTEYTIDDKIDSEIDVNNLDFTKPTKFTQVELDNLGKVEIEELEDDDSDILNLKDNFLPKGLAPLEDIFDSNDVLRKPNMEPLRSNIA